MQKYSNKIINIKDKVKKSKTYKIEEKIKGSDVLIFNNVCAVALKYDKTIKSAPFVVYKSDKIDVARLSAKNLCIPVSRHNIASDIALTLKTNDEIPSSMYVVVAEILASIHNKENISFDRLLDDAVFYNNFRSKLSIEFAPNLKTFSKSSKLTNTIAETRDSIISGLGLILDLPEIKINNILKPNGYNIKFNNITVGCGEVYPDKFLELIDTNNKNNLSFKYEEPVYGCEAKWVKSKPRNSVVVDSEIVIAEHLKKIIRENAGDLITRRHIYQLLDKLDIEISDYSYNIKKDISINKVQAVLSNLLRENVPILEIEKILETLTINNDNHSSIETLTHKVREALSMTICESVANNKTIIAITLSNSIENEIVQNSKNDGTVTLSTIFTKNLFDNVTSTLQKVVEGEEICVPAIICSSPIRYVFKKLIERIYPQVSVLSYKELHPNYKVKVVNTISFDL